MSEHDHSSLQVLFDLVETILGGKLKCRNKANSQGHVNVSLRNRVGGLTGVV